MGCCIVRLCVAGIASAERFEACAAAVPVYADGNGDWFFYGSRSPRCADDGDGRGNGLLIKLRKLSVFRI